MIRLARAGGGATSTNGDENNYDRSIPSGRNEDETKGQTRREKPVLGPHGTCRRNGNTALRRTVVTRRVAGNAYRVFKTQRNTPHCGTQDSQESRQSRESILLEFLSRSDEYCLENTPRQ